MQELDSRLDALNHQLATIPEAAALAELTTRRAELDGEVRDLRVEVVRVVVFVEQEAVGRDHLEDGVHGGAEQVLRFQGRDQGLPLD